MQKRVGRIANLSVKYRCETEKVDCGWIAQSVMSSHGVAIYVSFRNIRKDSIEREVYRWAEPYSRPSIPLFVDTEGSTSLNACRETVGRPFRRERRPPSTALPGVNPTGRER